MGLLSAYFNCRWVKTGSKDKKDFWICVKLAVPPFKISSLFSCGEHSQACTECSGSAKPLVMESGGPTILLQKSQSDRLLREIFFFLWHSCGYNKPISEFWFPHHGPSFHFLQPPSLVIYGSKNQHLQSLLESCFGSPLFVCVTAPNPVAVWRSVSGHEHDTKRFGILSFHATITSPLPLDCCCQAGIHFVVHELDGTPRKWATSPPHWKWQAPKQDCGNLYSWSPKQHFPTTRTLTGMPSSVLPFFWYASVSSTLWRRLWPFVAATQG